MAVAPASDVMVAMADAEAVGDGWEVSGGRESGVNVIACV